VSWNDIIIELDHTEFVVKDRQGLNLLFTALRLGLQNQGFHPEVFPVDFLYRHWKNADGQVISIKNLVL
jgi:CCR4-NOT transcription complex subunit 1